MALMEVKDTSKPKMSLRKIKKFLKYGYYRKKTPRG